MFADRLGGEYGARRTRFNNGAERAVRRSTVELCAKQRLRARPPPSPDQGGWHGENPAQSWPDLDAHFD